MLMNLFGYHVKLSSNYINCLVPNRGYFQMQLVIPSHLNTCDEIFQNIKNIKNRLSKESRIEDDSIPIANFSLTYMLRCLLNISFLLIYRIGWYLPTLISIYHPLWAGILKVMLSTRLSHTQILEIQCYSVALPSCKLGNSKPEPIWPIKVGQSQLTGLGPRICKIEV